MVIPIYIKSKTYTIMKIEVTKTFDVQFCNQCPYFRENTDYTSCYDSFDEPNYDQYCANEKADNTEYDESMGNIGELKYIDTAFSRFNKECEVPEWCPYAKHNESNSNTI